MADEMLACLHDNMISGISQKIPVHTEYANSTGQQIQIESFLQFKANGRWGTKRLEAAPLDHLCHGSRNPPQQDIVISGRPQGTFF